MQTIVTSTDEAIVRMTSIPLERYATVEAGVIRWMS